MAKKSTRHPSFKVVTVTDTKGKVSKTRSTYRHDTMRLEVDPNTHPAWTNQKGYVDESANAVASFKSRFAGLDFLTSNN